MLQGLQEILEKKPVLPTVNADDVLHDASKVEADYQKHVSTFIPMGDITEFSSRLAKRVTGAKTAKGMLVAPYGYGKTSTLAFLWQECEKDPHNLLAVPPFYCATLLDILKATYGWVKFRLQHRQPGLMTDLDEIYHKYTAATVEEMAARYAREHGLAPVTAVNMLRNMLDEGSLVLELTPSNLLFFLDATVSVVIRAGFKGLVIFPDEFQQYFSKGANLRRTVQEFREFIWGLDTRANALGVIFSLPTYHEGAILEHGKDILHRLKKDNLYYALQDIYSVEFPKRLWNRYITIFHLEDVSDQVMGLYTLEAIGQIAERDDLGEGPRTVIDSFIRAIHCYQDHQRPYTPIDLIDDFLESNIRFQAQTNKIKIVTRQALSSTVVDTTEKKQAIKLMAAFPQGCPSDVQKKYAVYEVINTLSKQTRGDLMTHLTAGYTLLGLSRTGGPTHTVDIIIRDFWQGYEEDELHLETAARAFIEHLLPGFFKQRQGAAATGWSNLNFAPSASGSYVALIEGTFNPQYPRRLLGLQVAQKESQLQPAVREADFQFDFLFNLNGYEENSTLVWMSDRSIRFQLNLKQKLGPGLPQDLHKLQDFVNPDFVTPLLMLSLVDYFNHWAEIKDQSLSGSDRTEIDSYYIPRLINHTEQTLLAQSMAESITPPLRRVGRLMFEEIFNRLCENLYPRYSTLFVHAQYEAVLNNYINALLGMTLKERRGHSPLHGTKEAMAKRFAVSSVATFENRTESEYASLMKKGEWKGRGDQAVAEIVLQLHPLEREILDNLRNSSSQRKVDNRTVPVLSANQVAEIARRLGYRDEETMLALQLLAARGYSRFDQHDKIVYLSQVGPDPAELRAQWEKLVGELKEISDELLPKEQLKALQSSLAEVSGHLEQASQNEEELDELQTRLSDLNRQLSEALSIQRETLRSQLNVLVLEVERAHIRLRQSDSLDREIQGQVAFVMHLNELRQQLLETRGRLASRYAELKKALSQALSQTGGGPITEAVTLHQLYQESQGQLAKLEADRQGLETRVGQLERWIKLLKDSDQLFNALARLPDLREQLTQQVVPEIQAHFTKRRQEGLADWEPFQTRINAVETELEKRRRHGNESFNQIKESYEQFLREIEVDDYRPRTRYTYGEDEASYRDLYEEVLKKVEGRLKEIEIDFEREQTDLLKAKYIYVINNGHQKIVQQIEKELANTQAALKQLQRTLTIPLIQQAGDELISFSRQIQETVQTVASVRQQLGPLLFGEHQLTPEETKVLAAFGSKNDVDLTDLFVSLRQAKQVVELKELLESLEGLYRKNRIIIRVRQRG